MLKSSMVFGVCSVWFAVLALVKIFDGQPAGELFTHFALMAILAKVYRNSGE